jgi:hypothetical protein
MSRDEVLYYLPNLRMHSHERKDLEYCSPRRKCVVSMICMVIESSQKLFRTWGFWPVASQQNIQKHARDMSTITIVYGFLSMINEKLPIKILRPLCAE